MRLFLTLVLFLKAVCGFAFENPGAKTLKISDQDVYNISEYLSVYAEGVKPVEVKQAFLFFQANKFVHIHKTNNEYLNDGLVNRRSWFVINLENTKSVEVSLAFEYILSGANSIACYTSDNEQQIQSLAGPENNSPVAIDRLMAKSKVFNLILKPHEKITLLMLAINKGHLFYMPAKFYSLNYFRETDSNKNNFLGIFQGIFIFIIIFNLLLYFTTLDRIYLLYLLYAFFISLFALNEAGTAVYSMSLLPGITYLSGQTFLFSGFSIWLLLMLRFLNLTNKNHILFLITILFVITDLIIAYVPYLLIFFGINTTTPFQKIYQLVVTLFFGFNLLFIMIANIIRIIKGSRLAIFYALANIPVIAGAFIYYSNYYNITDIDLKWANPVAFGLSIETFLISFGFAYRYNLINKQKQELLIHINQQQKDLTKQIIQTQEMEQKRIAEDLHDELGGNLAAIKISLQKMGLPSGQSFKVNQLIDNASNRARQIAHNLMPPDFENTTLRDLLDKFFLRITTEGKINFLFHYTGPNHRFTKQEDLIIYRIILELTNNIIKHSEATEATIQLIYYDQFLELMVEDNGVGFGKAAAEGIGLKTVQSRVKYLNGTIRIDTSEKGSTIIIHIPFNTSINAL